METNLKKSQYNSNLQPLTMWLAMLIIFVTYAMMPMPLSWSFVCSLLTAFADILISFARTQKTSQIINLVASKLIVYFAVIFVSLYAKYLIDLKQRNAFLETRRSLDTRAKIERENSKQVSFFLLIHYLKKKDTIVIVSSVVIISHLP